MILLRTLNDFPDSLRGGAVAIGNFDGVHLGHARLVERLRAMAKRSRRAGDRVHVRAVADASPSARGRSRAALWLDRKIEILDELGADAVLVYPTDKSPSRNGSPAVLRPHRPRPAGGPGDGRGTELLLRPQAIGQRRDSCGSSAARRTMPFEVVEPVEIGGQIVSSSRVRSAVMAGRVDEARAMLGRPYRIRGTVVRGAGRGATIGYPTANVGQIDTLLPGEGIYAGQGSGRHWPRKAPRRTVPCALRTEIAGQPLASRGRQPGAESDV